MPDTRSTRRGRFGGAGDTRGGRCLLLPASRAAPVPSRYFPCRTCSSPGWRSRCCLICSSAGKGLSSYCASPPPPGACLPAFCSLRRGEGEVTQGAAMWEKPPLHARSSLAPWVASPSLSCPPALPIPCRGAVGQGLPHGGAGTIWEGGHVTLAGRERHVKGSAEALFGSRVAAESPARGPRPHPMPDPSSRGSRAMGRGPQGCFPGRTCPASG